MTWLEDLIQQHHEYESPLSFWKWSGLAAVSAVVKDQVWLPRYLYNLYPNIYVMFHAESGLKKGPPVAMASKLVTKINNTKVITGRSSIQGILKDMGNARSAPGGKIVGSGSTAFICSSELSSSIVDDPVAAKILTDLYDRHYRSGEWASLLKMETFKLNNPTITMLTATNEAMSEDFFDKAAVQGGYFARTFIVYEKEENRSNALIVPPRFIPDTDKISEYLKKLSSLKGPFLPMGSRDEDEFCTERYTDRFTKEIVWVTKAGLIYQQWYDDFKAGLKDQEKDETGTLNRFGDSVLKVAMLLSLAQEPTLFIDETSMTSAIEICERLIGNVRKVTLGKKGISQSSILKAAIINEFLNLEYHQISKKRLMKKMWMHYENENEFVDLMNSFEQAGMIRLEQIGSEIIYKMPDSEVEEYKRRFRGKK